MAEPAYLSAKEAVRLFISKPSVRTLQKWMKIGVHNRKVPNGLGERIKLQCVREGGFILTTLEWVKNFQAECQSNKKGA